MPGPGLLRRGDDLGWRQQEAVDSGVSELDAVDVGDARHTQGPVQGGSRGHVEDTRNTSWLVILAVGIKQCVIASIGQVIHGIIAFEQTINFQHLWIQDSPGAGSEV